jgi:hypothetical protein
MATKLVLIPYLQGWDRATLSIRLLCLPRGSPLDPLTTASSAAFATANLTFDVHVLTDVEVLPTPGGLVAASLPSPSPATAPAIFQALSRQFPIDPIAKDHVAGQTTWRDTFPTKTSRFRNLFTPQRVSSILYNFKVYSSSIYYIFI